MKTFCTLVFVVSLSVCVAQTVEDKIAQLETEMTIIYQKLSGELTLKEQEKLFDDECWAYHQIQRLKGEHRECRCKRYSLSRQTEQSSVKKQTLYSGQFKHDIWTVDWAYCFGSQAQLAALPLSKLNNQVSKNKYVKSSITPLPACHNDNCHFFVLMAVGIYGKKKQLMRYEYHDAECDYGRYQYFHYHWPKIDNLNEKFILETFKNYWHKTSTVASYHFTGMNHYGREYDTYLEECILDGIEDDDISERIVFIFFLEDYIAKPSQEIFEKIMPKVFEHSDLSSFYYASENDTAKEYIIDLESDASK